MADANEDDFRLSYQVGNALDSEDDDLPPDFLNLQTSRSKGAIPKRGMKDFESNTTQLQSRTLATSRHAMWDTLSALRVHHASTFEWRKIKQDRKQLNEVASGSDAIADTARESEDAIEEVEILSVVGTGGTPIGIYDPKTGLTTVDREHVRTTVFATIGMNLSGGSVVLLPEEALWALEGSKLDVRYPRSFWENEGEEEQQEVDTYSAGMPMSLQGAYTAYIGEEELREGKLTLEMYLVYASLKRQGFIVLRAPEWDKKGNQRDHPVDPTPTVTDDRPAPDFLQSLFPRLFMSSLTPETESTTTRLERQRVGPLVRPGLYRSYVDIYRLLFLIPRAGSTLPSLSSDAKAASALNAPYMTMTSATPSHSRSSSRNYNVIPSAGKLSPVLSPSTTRKPTLSQPSPKRLPERRSPPKEPHPFTTHWNVYKPPRNTGTNIPTSTSTSANTSTAKTWKKSSPGVPDFRICVVSARDTNVPNLSEMEALFQEQPFQPPHGASMREQDNPSVRGEGIGAVYARLKHGWRNVVLAVVNEGVVNFVRLADAGFAGERLYERVEGGRGGKGGGRGRGGGRVGRGRGREG